MIDVLVVQEREPRSKVGEGGAPAQRLVIEVDGAYHGERARADARRDAALERAGYRVVRLEASLIASDISGALAVIRAARLA
jgi:very-short-patch-repair endonuclease